jgi:hypothetical protein
VEQAALHSNLNDDSRPVFPQAAKPRPTKARPQRAASGSYGIFFIGVQQAHQPGDEQAGSMSRGWKIIALLVAFGLTCFLVRLFLMGRLLGVIARLVEGLGKLGGK